MISTNYKKNKDKSSNSDKNKLMDIDLLEYLDEIYYIKGKNRIEKVKNKKYIEHLHLLICKGNLLSTVLKIIEKKFELFKLINKSNEFKFIKKYQNELIKNNIPNEKN